MERGFERVLELFRQINAIPRCSGNESGLREWIDAWAAGLGFSRNTDAYGNLMIRVPATESSPAVILQGHMDMVCEKPPESPHDFTTAPIEVLLTGDWIHANDTTLGADNGIALALAMAVSEFREFPHPPLELLFTVEEETGLVGAMNLDPEMLSGEIMLNLDSDREAEFTVGCAGGRTTTLEITLMPAGTVYDSNAINISVGGLTGGHSGTDIHRNRANANLVLAEVLRAFRPFRLVEISGGTASNAIPREASATILSDPAESPNAAAAAQAAVEALKTSYADTDPGMDIVFEETRSHSGFSPLSPAASSVVVDLLLALPNGIVSMEKGMEGCVETSCNVARIDWHNSAMRIIVSQRSSNISSLDGLTRRIEAVASLAGCKTEAGRYYPSWLPRPDSPVLARSLKIHENIFGVKPKIRVVHAGLECGVIGSLRPGMDMLSFGVTIENPHSPTERMLKPSVQRTLLFLTELLRSLAEKPLAKA